MFWSGCGLGQCILKDVLNRLTLGIARWIDRLFGHMCQNNIQRYCKSNERTIMHFLGGKQRRKLYRNSFGKQDKSSTQDLFARYKTRIDVFSWNVKHEQCTGSHLTNEGHNSNNQYYVIGNAGTEKYIYIYTYTKQDNPFLEPPCEDHSLHNCKGQRVHIA